MTLGTRATKAFGRPRLRRQRNQWLEDDAPVAVAAAAPSGSSLRLD